MVNDSAGTDVILTDKSQRPAGAAGFRAAVAIEAERGLCNKPVLITGTDDFVKVFGNPNFAKYGQANTEAYFLAQNNVPLVISRAKNPGVDPSGKVFGCLQIKVNGAYPENGVPGKLTVRKASQPAITAQPDDNICLLYFKGEGQYPCEVLGAGDDVMGNRSNIVLRFSKPTSLSAYANAKRAFRLQVFDFAGIRHIDKDTSGILGVTPNLEPVFDNTSENPTDALYLKGYTLTLDSGTVTVFVNGVKGTAAYDGSVYTAIANAVKDAAQHAVDSGADEFKGLLDFASNGDGTFTVQPGAFNCLDLSISISISATFGGSPDEGTEVTTAYYNYGCGSVSVTPDDGGETATISFQLSTGLYLENRKDYMYMGDENSAWASYYSAYCKESYVASFGYEDYDASYNPIQLDTMLAASNYLISKTGEAFADYAIDFADDIEDTEGSDELEPSAIVADLQYFSKKDGDVGGDIVTNAIEPGQRSYAYATALRQTMGNNLTNWRCVVTPNLGDVMNKPDFIGVIEAASETTLGLSNIGKAASLNAFDNLGGRHGYRFIADFTQYGRRNVAGRRMWLTMAALVTLTLNNNYKNGNEARPPLGETYGIIQCDALSQDFSGPQRKMLAETYKVNPVIDEGGFYAWEEKTSQELDSALSDAHVILSFCWMKYAIYPSMRKFVGEYNDVPTVNEGLRVLKALDRDFRSRNYINKGKPNADKNVIGDQVMRFDYPVRFMGVSRYVDVYVTAYSQTQSLEISLAEEA